MRRIRKMNDDVLAEMNNDVLAVLIVAAVFLPVFLLIAGCFALYVKEGSSRIVSRTRKGRG